MTTDALGSPRIKTDANGNVISRSDNLPFGEDLYTSQRTLGLNYTTDNIRRKFTTYKRDDETGLDFAESRYYAPKWGRFVSPDEFTGGPDELFDFEEDASDNPTLYSDLENPQSLNKYQYTYNNPLNLIDEDGHCPKCKKAKPALIGPLLPAAAAALLWILANPDTVEKREPQSTGEIIGDVIGIIPGGRGVGGVLGGLIKAVTKGGKAAVTKGGGQVVKQAVKQPAKQVTKQTSNSAKKRLNKVSPKGDADNPAATGAVSMFKRNQKGKITNYTTFDKQGRPRKRFRGEGGSHGGVNPPIKYKRERGKSRDAEPKRAVPARKNEIPQ